MNRMTDLTRGWCLTVLNRHCYRQIYTHLHLVIFKFNTSGQANEKKILNDNNLNTDIN